MPESATSINVWVRGDIRNLGEVIRSHEDRHNLAVNVSEIHKGQIQDLEKHRVNHDKRIYSMDRRVQANTDTLAGQRGVTEHLNERLRVLEGGLAAQDAKPADVGQSKGWALVPTLKLRVKELEAINEDHREVNGQLREELRRETRARENYQLRGGDLTAANQRLETRNQELVDAIREAYEVTSDAHRNEDPAQHRASRYFRAIASAYDKTISASRG